MPTRATASGAGRGCPFDRGRVPGLTRIEAIGSGSALLAGMLEGEAGALKARRPEAGALLGMLDADGDGSILDDAAEKLGKGLLGSLFKR